MPKLTMLPCACLLGLCMVPPAQADDGAGGAESPPYESPGAQAPGAHAPTPPPQAPPAEPAVPMPRTGVPAPLPSSGASIPQSRDSESLPARYYGYQILLVDALGLGAALATDNGVPFLITYLGAPLIHGIHGNGKGLATSLLLRTLLPLGGALAGSLLDSCDDRDSDVVLCPLGGIIVGFAIGVAAGPVIDWTVLGKTHATPKRSAGPTAVPGLTVTDDRITFGVAGAF